MTLRDVADPAGVSIAYLSDLERGKLDNPTLDTLSSIARALDASLNELLALEGEDGATRRPRPRSPALLELAASASFNEAIDEHAKRMRAAPAEVRDEWLALLDRVEVAGRRPRTSSDYMFIFEAIRRAVEPR